MLCRRTFPGSIDCCTRLCFPTRTLFWASQREGCSHYGRSQVDKLAILFISCSFVRRVASSYSRCFSCRLRRAEFKLESCPPISAHHFKVSIFQPAKGPSLLETRTTEAETLQ